MAPPKRSRTNLEALGYEHATTAPHTACPTRIGKPAYFRGFTAGWRASQVQA